MGIFNCDLFNTSKGIAEACAGTLYGNGNVKISDYTADSRKAKKGDIFFAIKGENFDGNDFIAKAVENGAECVLCERIPEGVSADFILVEDTVSALGRLANAYLKTVNPLVIGVTGSVGKTTTKQFIYSVMSRIMPTQKTEGNFNNEIGLPYTVFALKKDTRALVLEMGMSFKGEMHRLSLIANPDIACVTNIGTAHIENLGSRENIAAEKLSVSDGLKAGGRLILNGDEPLLWGKNAIYIGIKNKACDYIIENIKAYEAYSTFTLKSKDIEFKSITVPVIGEHNVFDAAYGAVAGILAGGTEEQIREGILSFENTGMRQKTVSENGYNLIVDCYNASPESMKASVDVLKQTAEKNSSRSVAVLGEMRELGEFSEMLHGSVGKYCAENGVDALFTYGKAAEKTAIAFNEYNSEKGIENHSVYVYNDIGCPDSAEKFAELIKNNVMPGDTILFKASRALKLEDVIERFIEKTKVEK